MDLEPQLTNAANAAVAMVTTYGLRVVGAIVILVVGWVASRILYTAVVRLCEKSPRIDRTVVLFLGNGVRYAALVFTFVAVLTTFGIATTSFVAVLGATQCAALPQLPQDHDLRRQQRSTAQHHRVHHSGIVRQPWTFS